jgi:dihydroorotase
LENKYPKSMKIYIPSATIIDPNSSHHGKVKSILIHNGIVEKIGEPNESHPDVDQVISDNDLHVSPGLFDFRARFCDPGYEQHEEIETGIDAAIKGGFTGVAVMPSTYPAISNKGLVEYLINRTKGSLVDVFPTGTISHKMEGKELAEMYDMHLSGAIAFTDDKEPIQHPGLLSRALLYAKNFNGLLLSFPFEKELAHGGQIHEGIVSTQLGLSGIPALAEEVQVSRDIYLAEYNEARLHIGPISSAGSVVQIKKAKAGNLQITTDVAAHQLLLNVEACSDFDTNFKVLPPLRDDIHRKVLIEGLKNGTIDIICSDHSPYDVEEKLKEFDLAAFGIIGLQTAFSVALTALDGQLSLTEIIEKMAINPRMVLGLDIPVVQENKAANLIVYQPNSPFVFEQSQNASKSWNSPFFGQKLKGKMVATCNNGQLALLQ